MADEIRAQLSLQISKGNIQYQSRPTAFTADFDGTVAGTPGSILVSKYGTDVNLSQIILPGGMCWMENTTDGTYVEVGTHDPAGAVGNFAPLSELHPGEPALVRLSRQLGQEIGTGSGTTFTETGIRLRLKAVGGPAQVTVHAFDR